MQSDTNRDDWLVPALALCTFVLWDTIRVWIPSLLFIAGDAGSTSATTFGAIALATVALPLSVAALFGDRLVPSGWFGGVVGLLVTRVGLQLIEGGRAQLILATIGVIAGGIAIASAATGARSGWHARLGVLLGVAASATMHVALGGVDLAWRDDFVAAVAMLIITAAAASAARRATPQLRGEADTSAESGSALAWWSLGPALLLIGIQLAPPGRIATATGWPDPLVAIFAVVLLGLMIAAYASTRRFAPRASATASALALTVGVLGALRADAPVTLVGQLFLAAGVGGALGSMATMTTTSSRRRAVGGAGGLVVFVLLGFTHYAPYDMPMWYSPRVVLLAAAALLLVATVVLTRPTNVFVTRERPVARRLAVIAAASSLTAILVAAVSPAVDTDARQTPPDGTLRIAVINIRMGFDLAGRLGVDQLADELAALDPDVVVLNEVDRGWMTTGGRDTLRIVQRALGHDAIFAPAADDVWGNALLTRYPWEEVDRARLPQGRDAMARGQFSVLLTTELGRVAVVGTHLSHVDDRGDTRVPQARAVAATVARYAGRGIPTIVAGDFNATPESVELRAFGDFVVNAFDTGHPTWPADDPEVQIDHVLVSPSFVVESASHFGGQFSDHIGLVVDLTLEENA